MTARGGWPRDVVSITEFVRGRDPLRYAESSMIVSVSKRNMSSPGGLARAVCRREVDEAAGDLRRDHLLQHAEPNLVGVRVMIRVRVRVRVRLKVRVRTMLRVRA